MRPTTGKVLAVLMVLGLFAAACGNSESGDGDDGGGEASGGTVAGAGDTDEFVPSDEPGVSDDTIRVGGVASVTNPIGGNYGDSFAGVEAYFAMVNDGGGIYGRQLELAAQEDDQVANNQAAVQSVLSDDVFAVLPVATLLFTGAPDLASAGVPTFGWNIQKEWSEGPNLFGEKGSYLCFVCTGPVWPWVAQEMGVEKIGILAYGISEQSTQAAEGFRDSFEQYGVGEVVFFDNSLPYGVPDLSGEVSEMKAQGVEMVLTAMDQNGVRNLQLEMQRQGLDAIQYLSNAYDPEWVEANGETFEGSVVGIQFWPFEEETDIPPGMDEYQQWMEETGGPQNEISMAGWLNAQLFVEGLTAAGPEFTQQSVVDVINQMEAWTADGLKPPTNWTTAHEQEGPNACFSLLEIGPDGYTPTFTEPGKPFICLDNDEDATELPEAEITAG